VSSPEANAVRREQDKSGPVNAWHSGWRWLPLAAVIIVLDQITKAWIVKHFEYAESVVVLPVLNFTLRYNTGAAFSFLADASGWQRWFFAALAIVVVGAIVVWLRRMDGRANARLALSLSLILAGALGNVIDRLRLGHVVDFIHVHWNDAHFPAFNVADSAITIGAILMMWDAWLESRREKREGKGA
jgi:signal peptidase II